MCKISSLDVSRMRMEEDFGFMKLVKAELDKLDTTDIKEAKDAFNAAYTTFDDVLQTSSTLPSASVAAERDYRRDRSWGSTNAYLSIMSSHPTESIAAVARKAKAIVDKYGNPTSLPQTEESGVLHNLIQDLRALSEEEIATINYEPWLADLEASEDAFLEAVHDRTKEKAARTTGAAKAARTEMDAAYRNLVELVNALVRVKGADEYAAFIDHVDTLVERQRTVLKTRAAANAKKAKKAESQSAAMQTEEEM